MGEKITTVEEQSSRYANRTFKWVQQDYEIRFACEATDKLIRFTDSKNSKYSLKRNGIFILQTQQFLFLGMQISRNSSKPIFIAHFSYEHQTSNTFLIVDKERKFQFRMDYLG